MPAIDAILGNVPIPPPLPSGRRIIAASITTHPGRGPVPHLDILIAGPSAVTSASYPISRTGMPMAPIVGAIDEEVLHWASRLGVEGDLVERWRLVQNAIEDAVDWKALEMTDTTFWTLAAAVRPARILS